MTSEGIETAKRMQMSSTIIQDDNLKSLLETQVGHQTEVFSFRKLTSFSGSGVFI